MSDPQITPAPQDENQLIAERREKLKALREAQAQGGAVAFPNNFKPEDHAATLLATHGAKTAEELAAEGTAPISAKIAPDLIQGDASPFASRQGKTEITDSLINSSAMHHKPQTFLQWIIATADRVASGFEREEFERYNQGEDKTETGRNHYQARQLTLFEQIRLDEKAGEPVSPANLHWRYPLKALSPESLFPVKRLGYEPEENAPAQAEYRALWEAFLEQLAAIPRSHRQQWPLWLDHFDTAWQTFTHAIPSATAFGVKPDVSLYDHSKTTAALATALWRRQRWTAPAT